MEQAISKINGSELSEEQKVLLIGLCRVPGNGSIVSMINLVKPDVEILSLIILANTTGKFNFVLNL